MVCYTGAGISCSAGIPDFRGPEGVWTLAAQGKKAQAKVDVLQAIPTKAHMSLVDLQNRGVMKHLISSNCDGLHVKSGIKPDNITEVHGNSNREECQNCGKSYYRDYRTSSRPNVALIQKLNLKGRAQRHFTGRMCICGGPLMDSIINFGEDLSEKAIRNGFHHGQHADLMVAMGASLTVSPSCDMVGATPKHGGRLCIINLQKTPFDDVCDLRIFAKTDDVWMRVMLKLGFAIPEFSLSRRLAFWEGDEGRVQALGMADDGTPQAWNPALAFVDGPKVLERFERQNNSLQGFKLPRIEHDVVAFSMGHYQEPPVLIEKHLLAKLPQVLHLTYSPSSGEWKCEAEPQGEEKVSTLCKLIGGKMEAASSNDNNAVEARDEVAETPTGFAVYPKLDCPHVAALPLDQLRIDCSLPCESCGDGKENWLCLTCGHVACSRYVNSCMVKHTEQAHNSVLASFSDFSFWCTHCDEYVSDPRLSVIKKALEISKFG